MTVDQLWYRADRAIQQAEQAYHRLASSHDAFVEREQHRSVSRRRFRVLTERVERTGSPFGAHTIVYRESGAVLLVRHDGVDLWVLPGGEVQETESFREAAARELQEEAGIEAAYDGLAILTRVQFTWEDHEAWGVMPIFEARALETETTVDDPDGEISEAAWFAELPEDTRDRGWIEEWRSGTLEDG